MLLKKPNIWNSSLNSSEEEKDLAWKRIGEKVEISNGKKLSFLKISVVLSDLPRINHLSVPRRPSHRPLH